MPFPVEEIGFSDESVSEFLEGIDGEIDIIDVEGDSAVAFATIEEGVGVVDVQFDAEEGEADFEVGCGIIGEFDSDEIIFGEGEIGEAEDFAAAVGVVDHDADDGAVDGIGDAEGDDFELVSFQLSEEVVESSDSIFHKDAELAQGRPRLIAHGGGIDSLSLTKALRTQWMLLRIGRDWRRVSALSFRRDCRVSPGGKVPT